jgi:hypothetical protein
MKIVYKLVLSVLILAITFVEIEFHSEHWGSFLSAMLFLSGKFNYLERIEIISIVNLCFSIPILILFSFINNKWAILTLLILILTFMLMICPHNYIDDPTMNF